MPRNQPRTSSRSRQSSQPAVVQEDSLDEESSPLSKNRRRSPRNLDTFQKSAGGTAARVTRSLTRGSKGEPETKDADSEEEASESEPEVTSRKRSKSARKSSSKKRGRASKCSPGKASKKKGRPARKTRKQESEDEESEESPDLGESEEEEKVADDDDEEETKPEATPAMSRRGRRGGTRSSGSTSNPPASNKASPSVVLERVENVTPSSRRPTRGRGVKQRKAQASNEEVVEEAAVEGDEKQTPASRTSRARRGRPSSSSSSSGGHQQQQQQKQQQQQTPTSTKKTRQQPAKSEKMVPSEENAAALTTETVAKEEEKPAEKEEMPLKETTTEKKQAGEQNEQETAAAEEEGEEKMEVDEPAVQSTDEVSEVDEPSTEKLGKHKMDESKDEETKECVPAEKKAKTEEVSESKDAKEAEETEETTDSVDDEDKMEAAECEPVPKAEKEDDPATAKEEKNSSFQDGDKQEVTEEAIAPANENVTNGEDDDKKMEKPTPVPVEPRVNGSASDDAAMTNEEDHKTTDNGCDLEGSIIFASLGVKVPRRCVPNSDLKDNVGKDPFTVVSFNLAEEDWTAKHQNLVNEVLQLSPSILCLQEIDEVYFKNSLDSALKSHGYMGLYKAGKASAKGLATFYLLSSFEILHQREFEVHELLEKDVENTNLVDLEKEALKSFLRSPAPVLITKLKAISNGKTVTVGTVNLPSEDDTVLAIQVAAVLREIHNIGEGANNPHVLCGSFNLADDSIVYQLLSDGILKNEILDELKKNTNVPVPEKENASLAKLLEPCLQHPLSSLKSSYGSILGHELKFPDKTQKLSKDSLWFSSDSLLTKSILDVGAISEKPLPNTHISLKAELGFVN